MHGLTPPDLIPDLLGDDDPPPYDPPPRRGPHWDAVHRRVVRMRWFLLVVALPSLLTALYVGLIASRQYVSEAHFVVRAAGSTNGPTSGLGQLLGLGQTMSPSQTESLALGDYLTSHDAVRMLERQLDLVALFRRDGVDPWSRLRAHPTPETLLKYYRQQVAVRYNGDTGITTLRVRAFTPDDAFAIARLLLAAGEERVNALNRRAYEDAVAVSRKQLDLAERDLGGVQRRLTGFRQTARNIDPQKSSVAQIELVSQLEAHLATARAQLAGMGQAVSRTSPQYVAMRARVDALAAQVGGEASRLAGNARSMAAGLGDYEGLQLRQDFAAKTYSAAAVAAATAREQAVRQQLFVVRVVEPNLPVKSLYPERLRVIATVLVCLLLLYAVGWLVVAGVREHAA